MSLHTATSSDRLIRVTESEFPRAETCAKCHGEIFLEWVQSPHAQAYSTPSFEDATDGYRFASCFGCHAPAPAMTDAPPPARDVERHEGVTCVACHLEGGKIWGPLKPTGLMEAHPIGVAPERFRDGRICGPCHEGTVAEWERVKMDEKPSCQQCHMPPVTRKVSQASSIFGKPFVAFEKRVPQKRHTFPTVPAKLDSPPIAVEAHRNQTTVTLTIRNHLPHSLPPGDFGVRIVVLEVTALDANGESALLGRREFIKENGSAIPPRSRRTWALRAPAGAKSLRVRMWRHGRDATATSELIETEVPLR